MNLWFKYLLYEIRTFDVSAVSIAAQTLIRICLYSKKLAEEPLASKYRQQLLLANFCRSVSVKIR